MDQLPVDFFATSGAYTPHVHRDQYPAIDPTSSALSQAGKVIIITGASAGIGARGRHAPTPPISYFLNQPH